MGIVITQDIWCYGDSYHTGHLVFGGQLSHRTFGGMGIVIT